MAAADSKQRSRSFTVEVKDDVSLGSKRDRKLSEKGLAYTLEWKWKRLQQLWRHSDKVGEDCIQLMTDKESKEVVISKHKKWVELYDEFLALDADYRKIVSFTAEASVYYEWAQQRLKVFAGTKKIFDDWFLVSAQIEAPVETGPFDNANSYTLEEEEEDKLSNVSEKSILSARIAVEQQKAELEVQKAILKQRKERQEAELKLQQEDDQYQQDLEEKRYQLRMQNEENKRQLVEAERQLEVKERAQKKKLNEVKLKLQLKEEEMKLLEAQAILKARTQALDRIEHSPKAKQAENSIMLDDGGSLSRPYIHTQRVETGVQDNSKYTESEAFLAFSRHLNKPKAEVKPFSGHALEYQQFKRQFKTRVLNNCDTDEERLNYLEQYTTGEPNRIISGYMYLDATKGFKAAFKELDERYGDPEIIAEAFVRKALAWPFIKAENPRELDSFGIFLSECEYAMQDLDSMKTLEYADNFRRIVSKLPFGLHDKWRSIVQSKKDLGERPAFTDLVKFVRRESRKATDPSFGRDALGLRSSSYQPNRDGLPGGKSQLRGSFATSAIPDEELVQQEYSSSSAQLDSSKPDAYSQPCCYCKGSHALEVCRTFEVLPFLDRTEFLKRGWLCFACLRHGHLRRDCRKRNVCKRCGGRHPTVLHVDGPIPTSASFYQHHEVGNQLSALQERTGVTGACSNYPEATHQSGGLDGFDCTMAIIPVKVRVRGSSVAVSTYAFFDSGSNISFCTERLMYQLGVEGKSMKLKMETMGTPQTIRTFELSDLEVLDLEENNTVQLPTMYTKDRMPVSRNHIPTTHDLEGWPHLADITLTDLQTEVGLLIGNNVPDAGAPLEVRRGARGSPYATRSLLGWIPWNIFRKGSEACKVVNRADVVAIEQLRDIKDLNELYVKSIGLDYPEILSDDSSELSRLDKLFINRMQNSQVITDGRYEYGLPFKDMLLELPDNRHAVQQRLWSLQKKLARNPTFHRQYQEFMQKLLEDGHAEKVPVSELNRSEGRTWYIPHHGVFHPQKPNKIRVVFDCSLLVNGISLNKVLLQGPDLTNGLFGVLLRFRQEPIAVVGDIEKMFYQIKVTPQDRDCLRFYWWPDGDISRQPAVFRMTVHLFGAVSSPSVSNYALRQAIKSNCNGVQPEMRSVALRSFYVDDFLCAIYSEEQAKNVVQAVTALCAGGGFRLTKWISNRRSVIESIPVGERAADVADLKFETFPTEKALGVLWDIQKDALGFRFQPSRNKPTRRNLLSTVSSVFDPLGLAAPFVLPGKLLLQDLCRRGVDWDVEIAVHDAKVWSAFLSNLEHLMGLSVPRCFRPHNAFGKVARVEMHHFSDASANAYGTASYIRFVNDYGDVYCSLVLGKARVAPLKKITIPRMELTAATLAVKLNHLVQKELTIPISDTFYWTDSMAVLRYIQNQCSRFQTFVANRLSIIHEGSEVRQWRFVDGSLNPADLVSRGVQSTAKEKIAVWFRGPEFLWMKETEWPSTPQVATDTLPGDPEVKAVVNAATLPESNELLDELLSKFSSFAKLKRVFGWMLWFVWKLGQHVERQPIEAGVLPVHILEEAELRLIRYTQRQQFASELDSLQDTRLQARSPGVKPSSSLARLDPFISDNILRVGGRLNQSDLSGETKFQILLPRESALAKLIVREIHARLGHLGKNSVLAELRQKYWIPRAGHLIKGIISKCVDCRKYHAKPIMQKMADLPADRVCGDTPAFAHTGMDYFGPLEVKRGRTITKRYGVIFTCCSSRAVHLEVAHSLTTDSCINAIRRFLARRGSVALIRSDNGTNLVGAEKELRQEIEKWNQSSIGRYLQQRNISWKFNPPAASHFGGFWERLIRSVRRVMYSLLKEQVGKLDDEALSTVLCEVEQILNNRPLTALSDDPKDLEALTPNHLLIATKNRGLPPGEFTSDDNYVKRKWRQVQHVANVFWSRWSREYLPLLQKRQRWLKPNRNVAIGDLVLISGNTPRNVWSMGRVTQVHQDREGIVRVVTLATKTNTLQRPVHKLCLLMETDE